MKGTVPDIWRYINAFIIIIIMSEPIPQMATLQWWDSTPKLTIISQEPFIRALTAG
jgi:hypothetical protein